MKISKIITFSLITIIIISGFSGCILPPPDISGEWDGIFNFTDSTDTLTGIIDIDQDGTKLSGITGSIDDRDIELELTSREIFDPIFEETPWVITGAGEVNKQADEITDTWEESFFGSTGTFVLTK
jgi:hypothetical protein